MPPKAVTKAKTVAKAAGKPATQPKRAAGHQPRPSRSRPTMTNRHRPTPFVGTTLPCEEGIPMPVEVLFQGESVISEARRDGVYGHNVKLTAPNKFALVKSVLLTTGEYYGHQAILILPSKSFPFLDLPEEVRSRVYKFYFAPKGVVGAEIPLEGKRRDTRDMYAKSYANGSKYRVGLLVANRQVHTEAIPFFFANTLRLENTTTFLDFLGQLEGRTRCYLTRVWIKSYVKTTSRTVMGFLAEATRIKSLHIESGVACDKDVTKAVNNFHHDAHRFFQAMAVVGGNKTAGVDVLSFGREAFTYKDAEKQPVLWSSDMVQDFMKRLREKVEK